MSTGDACLAVGDGIAEAVELNCAVELKAVFQAGADVVTAVGCISAVRAFCPGSDEDAQEGDTGATDADSTDCAADINGDVTEPLTTGVLAATELALGLKLGVTAGWVKPISPLNTDTGATPVVVGGACKVVEVEKG